MYVWKQKGDAGSPTCVKKKTDSCVRACVFYVWLYVRAQTKQTYSFLLIFKYNF